MKHISAHSFKEVIEAERDNNSVDFINVCTPAEYKEKHIPGVRSVPLDELGLHLKEFSDKKTIYIHCRSGRRGVKAIEELQSLGVQAELINVEGGLIAWDDAGYDTRSLTKRMPIIRQVMVAAGSIILLGWLLSALLHPAFIYLSVVMGAGLVFAGVTGWCGLALLLARMPWNR